MATVLLLVCSNIFMTVAWYGHLKYGHAWPLIVAFLHRAALTACGLPGSVFLTEL
jgi:uncharacterized protein (DUF486 family)